jgi:hypothetical protein
VYIHIYIERERERERERRRNYFGLEERASLFSTMIIIWKYKNKNNNKEA